MLEELLQYGKTYEEVLAHKKEVEPYELLSNLSAIIMYKEQEQGIESLSQQERYVYAIDGMLTEVNNGGFDQFFYNSIGELAYDLIPALKAIGSVEFTEIASKAVDIFGDIPSLDKETRHAHLEEITQDGELQPWDECDDKFYDCDEQLESKAIKYSEMNLLNSKC